MTPAWTVSSWPPILWQARCASNLPWSHLGTQILCAGSDDEPSIGQTIWGGASSEGEAGVAWDWIFLPQGIVAMADPLGVVSNLRLLGDEGQVLTAWESARHLSEIVHALPWQSMVEHAMNCVVAD
jgi:hypothetical protein